MKIEAESVYIIQQSTNFSNLWYSFKSSVKAFKPHHSQTDPKQCKQNDHIPEVYSELRQTYNMARFSNKDNGCTLSSILARRCLRRLTVFSVRLCILAIMHWPIPEKNWAIIGKTYHKIIFQ